MAEPAPAASLACAPLFAYVIERRLRALVRPGAAVLDLGGGSWSVPGVRFEPFRPPHGPGGAVYDGACAGIGALDGADLAALGRSLAAALRPGAPVLLAIAGPRPAAARYGARRRAQRLLGPEFAWSAGFGLGVLLRPADKGWPGRHPQAFGALAALDALVRGWPVLRDLGARLVLEGARR